MNLASDDRARIPFALLAALLLVTSVSVAATIEQSPSGSVDTSVKDVSERLVAAESTAVRDGTRTAGATAAADPVVTPSNTSFGRVLDPDRPFASQLELLVYVEVASRLDDAVVRQGETIAYTNLRPVTNATTARDAIERTTVETAGDGAVDVSIEGAQRVVVRDGRTLDSEPTAIEARVGTPALTMHERTEEYETRLESGPATPGGIGPGFSGRVNGIAWTRGLAQYAGAPIEQVLAPRHVELAVNDAISAQQRAVFGTEDERIRRGLARQSARMAEGALEEQTRVENVSAGIRDPNAPKGTALRSDFRPEWFEREREPQPTPVEVGPHAGMALDRLFVGDGGPSLSEVIQDVYSADVRGEGTASITTTTTVREPRSIDDDWTLVDTTESIHVTGVTDDDGGDPVVSLPPGWRSVETIERTVRAERTIVRTYERGAERIRTRERRAETHAVAIDLGVRIGHSEHAPDRSERGFEPAGQLDGMDEKAVQAYLRRGGGADGLATRVVRGSSLPEETVDTSPPPELEASIREELWTLKSDLETEEVTVDRARIATSENPHAQLADALYEETHAYVRPPASYDGPNEKARVAARAAYLDRLIAELETGAAAVDSAQSGIDIAARAGESVGDAPADDVLVASASVTAPSAGTIEPVSPTRSLELNVDSDPGYFAGAGVDPAHLETTNRSHYPIAIRTLNAVSLPTNRLAEFVGEEVAELLFGSADRVALTTAAQSLAAVEAVPDGAHEGELDAHSRTLREEVDDGLQAVKSDASDGLADVTDLPESERDAAVDAGFEHWDRLDKTVVAANNGSAASAIADVVVAKPSTPTDPAYRKRVELRLRTELSDSLDDRTATVPEGPITDALDTARGETEAVVTDVTETGLERGERELNDRLRSGSGRVPLGVPIAPPKAWVATVNGWSVEVRGEYVTFAVESNRGGPANAPVTYQRHGDAVEIDVTGDGRQERLGTADRVRFSTWTTAIVAVPPGRSGVGNTDGRMSLRTPGWPDPGFDERTAPNTGNHTSDQ